VVKLGIIRKIAGLRKLIKQRDLMIPLPQRKKTSIEEGGNVYLESTGTHATCDV
jgi:hypothetical protein